MWKILVAEWSARVCVSEWVCDRLQDWVKLLQTYTTLGSQDTNKNGYFIHIRQRSLLSTYKQQQQQQLKFYLLMEFNWYRLWIGFSSSYHCYQQAWNVNERQLRRHRRSVVQKFVGFCCSRLTKNALLSIPFI